MTIGGEMLLDEFGGVLNVAKAYIRGEVTTFQQEHVRTVCSLVDIAAAEAAIRLDRGK